MIAYFLYKLASFLVIHLPPSVGYAIAVFLSVLKYYISPRDRRAVINNLKKILPLSRQKNIHKYARQVFINFGIYLVEFFRFTLLTKENLSGIIKIKGIENIENSLKKGKGVIVLTAHIGNWELGGVAMSLLGYPMIAVALPHAHHKVNAFFNKRREKSGIVVVPSLGIAIRRIFSALKANRIVALVGDRDFVSGGKKMSFLGAEKIIPRGPAVLALRTGAAVVPGFVIKQDDGTYILEFSKPLDVRGTEEEIMPEYVKVIEDKIRQYPSQWLMFREFWKE